MRRLGHGYGWLCTGISVVVALMAAGCGGDKPAAGSCDSLTGTSWVPNVAGAGAQNHDANVSVSKTVLPDVTGSLTGLAQGWSGREIAVDIDMTQDLGQYGSFSLVAETVGFPSSRLVGGAYPVLTYLSDGTNEFLNLARSGGSDCAGAGSFTCASGVCHNNNSCAVSWPSAYFDRTHWLQHQLNQDFSSYSTTNTFPTCNWSVNTTYLAAGHTGGATAATNPDCAFNTNFFSSGKLRTGTYHAKYILMADSYSSLTNYSAGLRVTVFKKSKNLNTNPGALDVNVVFVGCKSTQASRNAQGKVNLDSLMAAVHAFYSTSNVNVKLGAIKGYEWLDGEQYADLSMSDFGPMVSAASSILPSATEGKAVNVFFVDSVSDNSSLLGIAGGIGGPLLNGLPNSGVVVPTFGKLDQFNTSTGCTTAPCGLTQVDADFADLEQTVAHEMGHYLGLNHPSEADASEHDMVADTPICTAKDPSTGNTISIGSCRVLDTNTFSSTGKTCGQVCTSHNGAAGVYCSAVQECEFNYMMYWSSKYFTVGAGTGDGNMFSAGEGMVMNYCPLVQ